MQVEPAQAVGHDLSRQNANGELVPFAQAFGEGDADVSPRKPHLVGQFLRRHVEVREMVAPPLDLAPGSRHRVIGLDVGGAGTVIQPCESRRGLRGSSQQFLHFIAIDAEVRESLVCKTCSQPVDPADRLVFAQRTRIEIELFDQAHHNARADRPLVTFDQIEIAGGDIEPGSGGGLRQPFTLAKPTNGGTGKQGLLCHM